MLSDKHKLELLGLPPIETLSDLAQATHLSKVLLYRLINHTDKQYKVYFIPKSKGKRREICQPSKELKAVQSWILRNIADKLSVHTACKGFEKGSGIKDNVLPHIGALVFLCVDIENFFPSVDASRVWTLFRSLGYSENIAGFLTCLCAFKCGLPQGSPVSPKLANLCCYRLDYRLSTFAGSRGIVYSRYADDMTFSGYSYGRVNGALSTIRSIIKSEGFRLNNAKTRVMGPARRRKITGLVMASDFAGIGRKKLRELRAQIFRFSSVPKNKADPDELATIIGWLSYVKDVDHRRYEILLKYIANIGNRHPKSSITNLEHMLKA
jgi:RNA-directed DNA polymerase